MAKVLVTARSVASNSEGKAILEAAGHEIVTHVGGGSWPEEEMIKVISGMDAAIVGLDEITARVIAAGMPSLKIIARNGAGYNNVDVAAATEKGVTVTLAPGANTISVCELVFGLMLSLARQIPQQDKEVHKGGWKRLIGCELFGKVLGVIGTGHIGGEVIKRAQAFGMDIVAYDTVERPELCRQYGLKYLSREEVFRQADFLTLHVPAIPATLEMINSQTLQLMKPGAFLINTARGELVNEKDLYTALESGKLAGYGTDAFSQEPPGADNPLLSLSNVVATPHSGAYTREAVSRCSVTAAQEVVRVLAGQQPLHGVKK